MSTISGSGLLLAFVSCAADWSAGPWLSSGFFIASTNYESSSEAPWLLADYCSESTILSVSSVASKETSKSTRIVLSQIVLLLTYSPLSMDWLILSQISPAGISEKMHWSGFHRSPKGLASRRTLSSSSLLESSGSSFPMTYTLPWKTTSLRTWLFC